MSRKRVRIASGLTIILMVLATAPSIVAQPIAPQRSVTPTIPANLLRNGGFEGNFVRQWNALNNSWVNGRVAEGWTAWWRKPTDREGRYPGQCDLDDRVCQPWHEPEYRETKGIPYNPPRIREGENSQVFFTSFGLHEGGLYQRVVGAPRGWRVRFSIWVRAWSNSTEDTRESSGQPGLHLRLGIDPTGGVDPWSSAVIWGDEFETFDEFTQAEFDVTTQADALTVFFRSAPERALKHIDVVVDDAQLTVVGPPPPTPFVIDSPNDVAGAPTAAASSGRIIVHIVQAGDTLFAIAQQYRVDLAEIYALNGLDETSVLRVGQEIRVRLPAADVPTQVPPAPTPAPVAVGLLCVAAFEDTSGDGYVTDGESALPGAAFFVTDASGADVASADQARCFADLPAGVYVVSAQVPTGYRATTGTRWSVALREDARVQVVLGGQPFPTAREVGGDASPVPLALFGIGSMGALITLLVVLRQRAQSNR